MLNIDNPVPVDKSNPSGTSVNIRSISERKIEPIEISTPRSKVGRSAAAGGDPKAPLSFATTRRYGRAQRKKQQRVPRPGDLYICMEIINSAKSSLICSIHKT